MANPEIVRNVGLMQGEFAKFLNDKEGQAYGKAFAGYLVNGDNLLNGAAAASTDTGVA